MPGTPNHKVLVIENQFTQFIEIKRYLSDLFTVYPEASDEPTDVAEFKRLIDPVRIFLNERYALETRNLAGKAIADYINDKDPDVLIIDHILVGHYTAKTGIDLAIFIREDGRIKDNSKPILFLSRTPSNSITVITKIGKVLDPKFWIGKGYNGSKVLHKDFIKDEVAPEIVKLIKRGRYEKVNLTFRTIVNDLNDLDDSIDLSFINTPVAKEKLKNLEKDEIEMIMQFQKHLEEPISEEVHKFVTKLKNILS